jgi:hypothetical protein
MLNNERLKRKFRTPRTAKQEAVKENILNQVQEQTKYSSLRGVHVTFYISQVYVTHNTGFY